MTSIKVDVTETSQVGEARRSAVSLAQNLGFNEIEASKAAIIASEMASNLARYAEQGEIVLRSLENANGRGLELLAIDKGPGMSDVGEFLRDGYSTTGSAGIGFGAIARQSDLFDLYTIPGKGTTLLAQIWPGSIPAESPARPGEIGAICLPAPGQAVSGDAWVADSQGERTRILIADGLGHGEQAAAAAQAAVRLFTNNPGLGPAETVELAHTALHDTRGAVVAVAEVDSVQHVVRYCGVGNIFATIYAENQSHGLVSFEGIVGHTAYKFREFNYPYQAVANPILVMHSDGLGTHWNLNTYPGLNQRHPSLIAGVLYRDFKRPNDDMTVIVSRLH